MIKQYSAVQSIVDQSYSRTTVSIRVDKRRDGSIRAEHIDLRGMSILDCNGAKSSGENVSDQSGARILEQRGAESRGEERRGAYRSV